MTIEEVKKSFEAELDTAIKEIELNLKMLGVTAHISTKIEYKNVDEDLFEYIFNKRVKND